MLFVVAGFEEKWISRELPVMFIAISLFFDGHAIAETLLYLQANLDYIKPLLILLIVLVWLFLCFSVGYSFIVQKSLSEVQSVFQYFKNSLFENENARKRVIQMLTTFSAFVLVIAFLGRLYDFMPGESEVVGVYNYKWCPGVSQAGYLY